jgi:hypothetical protein
MSKAIPFFKEMQIHLYCIYLNIYRKQIFEINNENTVIECVIFSGRLFLAYWMKMLL